MPPKSTKKAVKEEEVVLPPAVEQVIQEVEKDAKVVEQTAEQYYSELKGKTVEELRQLHAEALQMESDAKRELHILMQRFAMKGTQVEEAALADLRVAMQKVDDAGRYLKALESKLYGELKDIWGTYF